MPRSSNPPDRRLVRRWVVSLAGLLLACQGGLALGQNPPAEKPRPDESALGRIFVMSFGRDDPMQGLTAVDPETGTWTHLIGERSVFPRVSPDGKRAVLSRVAGERTTTAVYDMAGDKEPVTLLDKRSLAFWSADGRELLASVIPDANGDSEFWRVSADGTRKEALKLPPGAVAILDWSSDGRWLLVASSVRAAEGLDRRAVARLPIDLMRLDGSETRRLWTGDPMKEADMVQSSAPPRFSPDGQTILAVQLNFRRSDNDDLQGTSWLKLYDAKALQSRTILEGEIGKEYLVSASWSPDGKRIAAALRKGEVPEIENLVKVLDTDGKVLRSFALPGIGARQVVDWR